MAVGEVAHVSDVMVGLHCPASHSEKHEFNPLAWCSYNFLRQYYSFRFGYTTLYVLFGQVKSFSVLMSVWVTQGLNARIGGTCWRGNL